MHGGWAKLSWKTCPQHVPNIYWKIHSTNIESCLRQGSWTGVETTALRSCLLFLGSCRILHTDSVECSKLTQPVLHWSFVKLGGPVCRDFPRGFKAWSWSKTSPRFVETFWKSWPTLDYHQTFEIQCCLAVSAILVWFWHVTLVTSCDAFHGISKPKAWIGSAAPGTFAGGAATSRLFAHCINWHSVIYHGNSWTKTGYKYLSS